MGRKLARAARTLLRRAGPRCARPAKVKRVPAKRGGGPFMPLPAPSKVQRQGELRDELKTPPGRFRPVKSRGAGAGIGDDPRKPRSAFRVHEPADAPARGFGLGTRASSHSASEPIRFFRVSDVGAPTRLGFPQEPTTAIGRGVVWFTGNSSVAYSLDRGRTFTIVDPSTVLPDDGLPFCCDQVVGYSPRYNLFVWLSQYWCATGTSSPPTTDCRAANTGSNRLRIAVATPEAIRANTAVPGRAWTYWDLPPSLFGQPAGTWFDYNELAVNRSSVTYTSNTIRGSGRGSLIARIPLSQLVARRSITISYIFDGAAGNMKPAQGDQSDTTYIAGNETLSRARLWSWPETSGTLFLHGVDHTSIPIWSGAVPGSDMGDWYNRWGIFPGQVASATMRGRELWMVWGGGRAYCTSGCGSGQTPVLNRVFEQPAILVGTINTDTWRLQRERWLWNPSLAFGYPSIATSAENDIGISFVSSAPNANPLPVAGWLTDREEFVSALPSTQPIQAGDYYSLRPGSTSSSFVFGAFTAQADPDGTRQHWHHIEYYRGAPPPLRPPDVRIQSPPSGREFFEGDPIRYSAEVNDFQDGRLPNDAIVWREDGAIIGRGAVITRTGTAIGAHAIEVTATNAEGLSASARITIGVVPAPTNAPQARITSPADGAVILATGQDQTGYYADVQFTAQASDPNGDLLTYRWTDSVNGGPAQEVSTVLSPLLRLRLPNETLCSGASHALTLSVSDASATTTVPITVRVYVPC